MPTCESMWGVIIFLRFFRIAGNCGLGYSLLICVLSFAVALLTVRGGKMGSEGKGQGGTSLSGEGESAM